MAERTTRRRVAAVAVAVALVLTACGSDAPAADVFAGVVRDPAPQVDAVALPSLSGPGTDASFRAAADGVKIVYFGYTNCPDVCPTTLFDVAVALRKLPPELAERVELVMVTIDPARDVELLDGYVRSFVPDAVAAGTDDAELLADAAAPFGVVYSVETEADGEIVVEHSTQLFLVDDAGQLVLTWPFGLGSDPIAADITAVLTGGAA